MAVRKFLGASVLGIALLTAGAAGATTITTATVTYPSTGSSQTDWYSGQNLALQQFNPLLGTLTSAVLYFSATANTNGSITNTSTTSSSTLASDSFINLKVDILNPNLGCTLVQGDTNSCAANNTLLQVQPPLWAPAGATTLAMNNVAQNNPSSTLAFSINDSTASGSQSVLPANFSLYEGTGTVTLDLFTAVRNVFDTTSGNISASETTTASASAYIVYTYSLPVPEPATLTLLGVGLIGLGAARRRSRKTVG
jgi:hypothetical protein